MIIIIISPIIDLQYITFFFFSIGHQSVIKNLQVIQANSDQILLDWELASISSQTNYTQSISIETDEIIVYSTVLEKHASFFLYASILVPCEEYNITVNVHTDNITCSDSITTTTYISGNIFAKLITEISYKIGRIIISVLYYLNNSFLIQVYLCELKV